MINLKCHETSRRYYILETLKYDAIRKVKLGDSPIRNLIIASNIFLLDLPVFSLLESIYFSTSLFIQSFDPLNLETSVSCSKRGMSKKKTLSFHRGRVL